MAFFRRKTPDAIVARRVTATDAAGLTRLIHTADHRFLTSEISELPHLLWTDPTAVLERGGRLAGALSFGWRAVPVAWIRTILLDGPASTFTALGMLSEPLYADLQREGMTMTAITLDEWSAPWLRTPLQQAGYEPLVEVVGYEKPRLDRPTNGNQVVTIRQAMPSDLQHVLALDSACFPLPWVKGTEILGPALTTSPHFIIAEFSGQPVGYAFVTSHHSGRLYHLVRIAVAPAFQGRGIGTRLLVDIVDFCAAQHADVLTLNTQADNYQAQRLYEWFGFVRNGDHQTVFGRELTL